MARLSVLGVVLAGSLLVIGAQALSLGDDLNIGRKLLQQNVRNLPANQDAYDAALNATGTGRQSLALYGTPNATLAQLVNYALLAHGSAEETFTTSASGQISATVAGAAAAGASLLATTAALANDSAARTEAQQALNAADSYVRAIRDENPLQISNSTLANLALLASLSHDATLTQYYQNATGGQAQDNETFADSLEAVPDLVETAQTQLAKGSSPALALITMEVAVRNIRSAAYIYNNNVTAAIGEGVAEARLILKAVNTYQRGGGCAANVEAAVTATETAVEAASSAAQAPTAASIQAALDAANSALAASSCTSLSPALAPAPASQATASGGR